MSYVLVFTTFNTIGTVLIVIGEDLNVFDFFDLIYLLYGINNRTDLVKRVGLKQIETV